MPTFDHAFQTIRSLADDFRQHEREYLSPNYSEAQARKDFIDKSRLHRSPPALRAAPLDKGGSERSERGDQ
jgi:hypothetical protein